MPIESVDTFIIEPTLESVENFKKLLNNGWKVNKSSKNLEVLMSKTINKFILPEKEVVDEFIQKLTEFIPTINYHEFNNTNSIGKLIDDINKKNVCLDEDFLNKCQYLHDFSLMVPEKVKGYGDITGYNHVIVDFLLKILDGYNKYYDHTNLAFYKLKSDFYPCNAVVIEINKIYNKGSEFSLQLRNRNFVIGGGKKAFGRNVETKSCKPLNNNKLKKNNK